MVDGSIPRVNLDYAASTPLRSVAIEAMRAYDEAPYAGANPNSLHTPGRLAAAALEGARHDIACSLGRRVRPADVIFTGGGTESDALALFGIAEGARQRDSHRTRVVTSAIEHDAILDNLSTLKARGFSVDIVQPNKRGWIEPDALAALIDDDVALVSIMFANNETGVMQPVAELSKVAHDAGANFHTDAIQGYLHAIIDVDALGVDALSLAGHKVGATVSSGALYLRRGTPFAAQVRGGGQEGGRRAGTQDVRSALALAAVARELTLNIEDGCCRVKALADALYARLLANERIHATMGDPFSVPRLPGIVSVYVDNAESEDLILQLDARGFCVSAGSACSSGSTATSHVLGAMGLGSRQAAGSLRISFDDRASTEQIDAFACTCIALLEEGIL